MLLYSFVFVFELNQGMFVVTSWAPFLCLMSLRIELRIDAPVRTKFLAFYLE